MDDLIILKVMDRLIKPKNWYRYTEPVLEGYRLIASKTDQTNAGGLETAVSSASELKTRHFGINPVKPYRDYYGYFHLNTKLLPEGHPGFEVKFAIGYTINNKVLTVDDYSNFGWLRMAKARTGMLYPNLSEQKQLLQLLLDESQYPRFLITRVYHYFQFEMYEKLTTLILDHENGLEHF